MDLRANEKSIIRFQDKLATLGISVSAYKVLETIFRQTIIVSSTSGYHYERDSEKRSLFNKSLSPRERLSAIKNYIQEWEGNSGYDYGFTLVSINEIDRHASLLHEYKAAIENLKDVFKNHCEIIDSEIAENFIGELQQKFKDLLRVNERPTGRYLDESTLSLRPENFDYFSRYIGFNYGIYHPLFEKLVESGDETKNNFFRFLSAKLNFECENNSHIKIRFTAKMLGDRIRKNSKGYDLLGEEPFKLGLIDNRFIESLVENQHSMPTIGPKSFAS